MLLINHCPSLYSFYIYCLDIYIHVFPSRSRVSTIPRPVLCSVVRTSTFGAQYGSTGTARTLDEHKRILRVDNVLKFLTLFIEERG